MLEQRYRLTATAPCGSDGGKNYGDCCSGFYCSLNSAFTPFPGACYPVKAVSSASSMPLVNPSPTPPSTCSEHGCKFKLTCTFPAEPTCTILTADRTQTAAAMMMTAARNWNASCLPPFTPRPVHASTKRRSPSRPARCLWQHPHRRLRLLLRRLLRRPAPSLNVGDRFLHPLFTLGLHSSELCNKSVACCEGSCQPFYLFGLLFLGSICRA